MLLNYRQWQSLLIGLVSLSGLVAANSTQAQSIVSDESLSNPVQITESENRLVSFSALTLGIPLDRQLVKTSGFICPRSQADFTSFELKPDNSLALLSDEIFLTQSTIDVSKGKLGLGNFVSFNSFRQKVGIEYGGIQINPIDGNSKPTTSELTTRSSNSGCSYVYYRKCQDCSRDGGTPIGPPDLPSCVCRFC